LYLKNKIKNTGTTKKKIYFICVGENTFVCLIFLIFIKI